jgi:ArsR family transcriptional regulator
MSKKEFPVLRSCAQDPVCCSRLAREPLGEQDAKTLAATFKTTGDPVRLRLLSLIASHEGGGACVCDLTGEFDVSQPTISHHLRVQREAGLIDCERRGAWVYYWVRPTALDSLGSLPSTDSPAAAATS